MEIINAVIYVLREIDPVWWIVVVAGAVILAAIRHRREQLIGNILIVYIALVYVVTVFGRAGVDPAYYEDLFNFDLVGTWVSRFTGDAYDRRELFLNFFMLMPLGVLFPAATKKKLLPTVLFCFLITVSVELLQALTGRGWFELTDIVDNTVGSAIGYGIYRLGSLLRSKLKCKKNN